jgi:hypothetical protein
MLRRPGERQATRLGEGCSSTAFGNNMPGSGIGWINPANRGSMPLPGMLLPAVP